MSRPAPDGSIAARLSAVKAAIAQAAERVGRDPGSVRIVAVTKGVGLEPIREALALGLRTLGENRVQEALAKIEALADESPQWHLVGHLQSNKARQAAERFSMVQSIDSVHLVEALAARAQRPLDVLIEVNAGEEPRKTGARPAEVDAIVRAITASPRLRLLGLMAIGPLQGGPEAVRLGRHVSHDLGEDERRRAGRPHVVGEPVHLEGVAVAPLPPASQSGIGGRLVVPRAHEGVGQPFRLPEGVGDPLAG